MYNFCTAMGILGFIGFGFYLWDKGGWHTLLGVIVLCAAVGFYFRWERRLFKD